MPITYHVDEEAMRVIVRFWGTVSDGDLLDTFDRLYSDPRHRVGMPELTDCRVVERVEITSRGLHALAAMMQARFGGSQTAWKTAVVAPQDEVFGLARMYEQMREGSPEQIRVFRKLEDAEQWLDE